jgi:hypothetical protein
MYNVSSINSNTTPNYSSFFNDLGGNTVGFGNVFSQALSQAKSPGDAAKVQWLQAEYSDLVDLSTLGSGSTSALGGLGMGDMFGIGGPLGLPSWTQDAERLLGNNSNAQQLESAYQQAAFTLQSQYNQALSNFGSTGGSVNSLI